MSDRRHEESMREARQSRRWAAIGAVGTLLAIVVSVVIALASESTSSSKSSGSLELVDSVVSNGKYPDRAPARIDVKLHNLGQHRIVLQRATITIEQVEQLSFCYSQGDLPVSNDYPITLTTHKGVVQAPLNQQLGPDAADRITLSLGVPKEPMRVGVPPHIYAYRFRVEIGHDGAADPVDVGQFVMTIPSVPFGVVWYWPKDLEGKTREELAQSFGLEFPYADYMRKCWGPNTTRLRSVLRSSGERSGELKVVLRDLASRLDPPS